MNKSLITNLVALLAMGLGYTLELGWLWGMGLFAFSGAVTNWLAIHMLFEKVPLLYGSGVIPARFSEFKQALYLLVMGQFFSTENLQRLLSSQHQQDAVAVKLGPVLEAVDLSPAFDALLDTVQKSSLGGMLAMFGGAQMLLPLKQPFIDNLKLSLLQLSDSPEVQQQLLAQLQQNEQLEQMQAKISHIVQARLDELTPQLVKELVQQLIREHLGWLVVWGGVFGALIGLASQLLAQLSA
ncbi:DUF445 domain-containing protein [Rheinheimera sp.]|uniref:DUF445 domain-containing protein n=1 Tax=Rheinheimera sp. TaxID=1869214 RepID=UPI00307CD022